MCFLKLYKNNFLLFLIALFFCPKIVSSQNKKPAYIIVDSITIVGNKLTKDAIIFREIDLHTGDTLSIDVFKDKLKISKQNLINTFLFISVNIDTVCKKNNYFDVNFYVMERWYIWPFPFFRLLDRNFNTWWEHKDIRKLNYGLDLNIFNFRGRKEIIKFIAISGYDKILGVSYKSNYLNKKQNLYLSLNCQYSSKSELLINTLNNKPIYFKQSDNNLFKQQQYALQIYYRKKYFSLFGFSLAYHSTQFSDTILKLNNKYALSNKYKAAIFSMRFQYDNRDYKPYPLFGNYIEFKEDIFINELILSKKNNFLQSFFTVKHYGKAIGNWYFAGEIKAKAYIGKTIPYFYKRGLGFENEFVRTYQKYVYNADGFLLGKTNLKYPLLNNYTINAPLKKISKFNKIPLSLYFNFYYDGALIYLRQQKLTNINGFGLGLDFTTYYDRVLRVETGINQYKEIGFFIHFMAPI